MQKRAENWNKTWKVVPIQFGLTSLVTNSLVSRVPVSVATKMLLGQGLGTYSLGKSSANLLHTGNKIVTLWVLCETARAISFYRKHGFKFDGKEKADQRETFALHELRMCLLPCGCIWHKG